MPTGLETGIYGKEVHVSKQKQTQKEIKGDLEITRHQTVTETREQEHKAITKERKVTGPVVREKYFSSYSFCINLIFLKNFVY